MQLVIEELFETDTGGGRFIISKNLPLLLQNLEDELHIKLDSVIHKTTNSFISKYPNLLIYDEVLLRFLSDLYHMDFLRLIESKRQKELDLKRTLLSPFNLSPVSPVPSHKEAVVKGNIKESVARSFMIMNLVLVSILVLVFTFSILKQHIIKALLDESDDLYWWQTIRPLEKWIWWLVDQYGSEIEMDNR